jgi:hypothetical protein
MSLSDPEVLAFQQVSELRLHLHTWPIKCSQQMSTSFLIRMSVFFLVNRCRNPFNMEKGNKEQTSNAIAAY